MIGGNLKLLTTIQLMFYLSNVAAEQMAWDDESDDGHDSCDKQLPRPKLTLEKECSECHNGTNKTAKGLWTETQDDSCDEASYADKQPLKSAVADFEDTGTSHKEATETADQS